MGNAVVETARNYIGKVKYQFGANNLDGGFADCSSFIQSIFKKHGISIPRTTGEQWSMDGYDFVKKDKLQEGDLVYFHSTYDSNYVDDVSHVGIYSGNNKFIHCSSSKGVTESSLDSDYWKEHYLGAKNFGGRDGGEVSSSGSSSDSDGVIDTVKHWILGGVSPVVTVVICGGLLIVGTVFLSLSVYNSVGGNT